MAGGARERRIRRAISRPTADEPAPRPRPVVVAAVAAALCASIPAHPALAAPPRQPPTPTGSSGAPARDRGALELIPGDATAVMRADPVELERAALLVRSLGGDIGLVANAISLASASALGFDALAEAGWRSIGIDAGQPVLIALGPIDPTAARALWHARVVARIADPRPFADWAGRSPVLGHAWRADRPVRGALGALLGTGDPRAEAVAARALIERGTIAAGLSPRLGALVLVRRIGPLAVLDAFALAEIGHLTWPRDGRAILAGLDAPAPGATMRDRASAAARALARPGLVFWTQPAGLADAMVAWRRPPQSCDALRDLAARTALVDGSLALRIGSHQLALDLVWGNAADTALPAALPTADDGLVGPPLRGGAVLAASIYLAGTARLRALPRPALATGGWSSLWRRARACGRPARELLIGFAWPELAAQWLTEVAAVSQGAARLIDSARNLGFAARRVSAGDRRGWRAVLEGSLAPAGMSSARAVLDSVFGARRPARRPRPHIAWTGTYLHPYVLPRGRRGGIVGTAIGDTSRRWRLEQPLRAGRAGPRTLARAAGDAAALLRQLAPDLSPPLRALAVAAARRVGSFEGSVTVHPDAIRASGTLRRR